MITYYINNMENVDEGGDILYSISYSNLEGQEYKFSFYYNPANNGVVSLKNQEQIEWRKEQKGGL